MGSAYRVTSEEFGLLMLDMTVCYECSLDARRLGLHTDEFKPRDAAQLPPDLQRKQAA